MRPPSVQGVWNPVVGSGAAYEMTDKQQNKTTLEMTVVGKEAVNGKDSYWLETGVQDPKSHNPVYMKMLMAPDTSGTLATQRLIMQVPGNPNPMEMSMDMKMGESKGSHQSQSSDFRERAERVGSENISVPAGSFACEHYRMKDGTGDVWFSNSVSPWGLVKFVGKDSSMVLIKKISDAKDHITGTPVKFDPMQMMHQNP